MTPRKARRFVDYLQARGHKLTPPQRVLCMVAFDDVDPCQLSDTDRNIARQLFGADVETIAPEARNVVALLKGARMGGTWLCSLYLGYRALVADLSDLAAGEMGFAPIVAPDMKTGRQALRFALGDLKRDPATARLIESEGVDGFVICRPDGRRVAVEVLAASRGGSSLRGRTMVAALMDESAFFRDPDSGVVNDSEIYRAIIVRLRGGKLCVISTAWMESGLLWKLVQENHNIQSTATAAIAPTLFMRPDDAKLSRIVADEHARDPDNAAREFDCIPFAQGSSRFFDPISIRNATVDESQLVLAPESWPTAVAGLDTGFTRDPSALVVVRKNRESLLEVAEIAEVRAAKGERLKPTETIKALVDRARYHKASSLVADIHYIESVREQSVGMTLTDAPSDITPPYIATRNALNEGKLRIGACHERLLKQLSETVQKPTSGGRLQISNPRKMGSHGDLVSAFVLAVWALLDGQAQTTTVWAIGGSAVPHPTRGTSLDRARAAGLYPKRGSYVL